MEKKILTEINRFRELMNLTLLSEGRGDLVSDVIKATNKLFSNAVPNSAEDIFNKGIISAANDTSKIKNIFASNPKLARKVIKQAIVDSGDKFFMGIEERIIFYIDSNMSSSDIKNRVKVFFDKNVTGSLKDEYLNTYNKSIDLLSSGQRNAKQVFGRDVKPFQPKNKPITKTSVELIDEVKKTFPDTPTEVFDQIKILSNQIDKLPTDADKFNFVIIKIEELTERYLKNKKLNREQTLNTIRQYKEAILTILPKIKNPKKFVLSLLGIVAILAATCVIRSVSSAVGELFSVETNRWSEILRKICLANGNSKSEPQSQKSKPKETTPENKPEETRVKL